MALGIPFTPAMAVVMAVLLIHGINPGPLLMTEKPDLFWGVIASMYIGNFMLLVFNLPLVGVFANIIRTPLYLLMPIVLLLCLVGVYSVNNSMLDIWLMTGFGLLGYLLRRLKYDLAPLVLALVLGPMMERSFREAMMISRGDLSVFLKPPHFGDDPARRSDRPGGPPADRMDQAAPQPQILRKWLIARFQTGMFPEAPPTRCDAPPQRRPHSRLTMSHLPHFLRHLSRARNNLTSRPFFI